MQDRGPTFKARSFRLARCRLQNHRFSINDNPVSYDKLFSADSSINDMRDVQHSSYRNSCLKRNQIFLQRLT